jgi:hypothetical protein
MLGQMFAFVQCVWSATLDLPLSIHEAVINHNVPRNLRQYYADQLLLMSVYSIHITACCIATAKKGGDYHGKDST